MLIGRPAMLAQLAQDPDAQAAPQDPRFELLSFEGVSYGAELVSAGTARALPMRARFGAALARLPLQGQVTR